MARGPIAPRVAYPCLPAELSDARQTGACDFRNDAPIPSIASISTFLGMDSTNM